LNTKCKNERKDKLRARREPKQIVIRNLYFEGKEKIQRVENMKKELDAKILEWMKKKSNIGVEFDEVKTAIFETAEKVLNSKDVLKNMS
jgi:hypothetical protein